MNEKNRGDMRIRQNNLMPPEWHNPPREEEFPKFAVMKFVSEGEDDQRINFRTEDEINRYIAELKDRGFSGNISTIKINSQDSEGQEVSDFGYGDHILIT